MSSEVSDAHRLTERECPCTETAASLPGSGTASALCIEPNSLHLPSQPPLPAANVTTTDVDTPHHGQPLPFLPALSNTDPAPIAWGGIAAGSLPHLEADPTGGAAWSPGRPRCPSTIPSKKDDREQSMGEVLKSWENRLFIATTLCIRGIF